MRNSGPVLALFAVALAGCGWSPPAVAPTSTVVCGPGPAGDVVADEISILEPLPWKEIGRGHAADCRLNWVVVAAGSQPDRPEQVLFFNEQKGIGAPTPEARSYISVTPQGDRDAQVQYQWRQGQDAPCYPTGIGTAKVTIEDGRLTIVGPIPGP